MDTLSLCAPKRGGIARRGENSTQARLEIVNAILSLVTEAVEVKRVVDLTVEAAELLVRCRDDGMTLEEIEREIIRQVCLARVAVFISS